MFNPETAPRMVVCTLDDHHKLIERAMELERELLQLKHEMELGQLKTQMAEVEERNTKLLIDNYNLRKELESREAPPV